MAEQVECDLSFTTGLSPLVVAASRTTNTCYQTANKEGPLAPIDTPPETHKKLEMVSEGRFGCAKCAIHFFGSQMDVSAPMLTAGDVV
jgi:hypothetical protein